MILLDQAGAGESGSRLFPAPPVMQPFVEHFWIQNPQVAIVGRTWRVVPDASPHLIFVMSSGGAETARLTCTLVGPRSCFVDVAMKGRAFTCGARLYPGTLPLLTRFPASDFTDRSVRIIEVFGARGRALMDQLEERKSPTAAIGVMADFLRCRFDCHDPVWLQLQTRSSEVRDLAVETGMPARTLYARTVQDVGLSPKRLLRIRRLHRTLTTCRRRGMSWAQAAAMGGFADQAHMVREFRDLLGESPTVWSKRSLPICSRQYDASRANLLGFEDR